MMVYVSRCILRFDTRSPVRSAEGEVNSPIEKDAQIRASFFVLQHSEKWLKLRYLLRLNLL